MQSCYLVDVPSARRRSHVLSVLAGLIAAAAVSLVSQAPTGVGQQKPQPATPPATGQEEVGIQDNSFLLEEAYNQDPGVVQHISSLQRDLRAANWYYTFTQEWPIPRQQHQLSLTLPVLALADPPGAGAGLGDIAINYRYQLVGSESRVAVAPRFSVLLPTGDQHYFRGGGGVGYQTNLALSVVVTPHWAAHTNAGFTIVPSAKDAGSDSGTTKAYNVGQSVIWLAKPRFNAMLEFVYTHGQVVTGPGVTEPLNVAILSPGVRWAYNSENSLQIVPGVAASLGIGPSAGTRSLFLYLSFEHRMWKPQ
jgi:hypothetical protein